MSPKYESVEQKRRRVFEEGRRLRELRLRPSKPPSKYFSSEPLIIPGLPHVDMPGDLKLARLEAQVTKLQRQVADMQAAPVAAESKTVSVLLVGFTHAERYGASGIHYDNRLRCSKSWTLQNLRPGDGGTLREIFCETILPGAWLIVQGPGLLSDVVVGARRCDIASHGSDAQVAKGARVCLRWGVLEGQELKFHLELAP